METKINRPASKPKKTLTASIVLILLTVLGWAIFGSLNKFDDNQEYVFNRSMLPTSPNKDFVYKPLLGSECYKQGTDVATSSPDKRQPKKEINPLITAYSPQKEGDSMEGGYESSRKGLDGKNIVRTLDDYATGKSQYVTLAGDPAEYGKTYIITEITYKNKKGEIITLKNVVGYVHDTGSAFKKKGNTRFDVPVGRDYTNSQINTQPYSGENIIFLED